MKKLMLATLALAAAFTLTADNYTPSSIPSGLTEPDVTPGEINYQGLLRNPKDGNLYKDGIYTLECRIYTDESTGTPLWGASYTAYVKDGYFNLMLGTSGAELSGCTYKSSELWKALWYTTGRRDLYLGVTPREGADGVALVSPQEIKPRQKLLTAPFAFRAQKAQYADAAPGNFNVGGNLEVSGNVTVANGKKLTLKNISASDSDIKIGNSSTSPATTTLQGSKVTIESGSTLNVNSHGTATVTIDAGKTLNVNGGHLKTSQASADIKASQILTIDSREVYITSDLDVGITAKSGIALNDTNPDGLILGGGKLRWQGKSSRLRVYPFVVDSFGLSMPAGSTQKSYKLEDYLGADFKQYMNDYRWVIGGYEVAGTPVVKELYVNTTSSNGPWIELRVTESANTARLIVVHVFGILSYWCNDRRE